MIPDRAGMAGWPEVAYQGIVTDSVRVETSRQQGLSVLERGSAMNATTEDRVGKVSRARYEELVADGLEQLALAGAVQLRRAITLWRSRR